MYHNVQDIREIFASLIESQTFVVDKTGVKMLEMVGACFNADEPLIFGLVNEDYVQRELDWYLSESLSIYDIPGGPPKIWEQVASKYPLGFINSNYGWAIFSSQNGRQYDNVLKELLANPWSRRAVMIYTRPTMHTDYNWGGMSDFMCTNAVQYLIRDDKLNAIVQMRSNDIWSGYRNDYAWQKYVLDRLANALQIEPGQIIWNAGSLHCYEKDFYLVDHFAKTGEEAITKKDYRELYPNSEWGK